MFMRQHVRALKFTGQTFRWKLARIIVSTMAPRGIRHVLPDWKESIAFSGKAQA
jgi:hypothetical protein